MPSAQISPHTVFLQTLSFPARVGNGWIEAHWMEDGHRFWYVEASPGEWSFHENDLAHYFGGSATDPVIIE